MPVILVVERDARLAERIGEALRSDDLSVETAGSRAEAIQRARSRAPKLLLVDAAMPGAEELLAAFSRSRGGPGAVALVSSQQVPGLSASDLRADEVLAKPFSDDDLLQLVRRRLDLEPEGRRTLAGESSEADEQLTSDDIFGDVLAEFEAEAQNARSARSARPRAPEIPMEDIERKLEETLSGVIPIGGKGKGSGRRRPSRPEPPTESEIDQLLDETLSSLDLPTRAKKPPPVRARTEDAGRTTPVSSAEPPSGEPQATRDAAAFEPEPEPPKPAPPKPSVATPAAAPEAGPRPATPIPAPASDPGGPGELAGGLDDLRPDQFATQAVPALDLFKELAAGEPFGDYTLLDRIAVGGMAEVWRARRRGVEGFQKTVAIKKILSHLTGSQDFVTMFIDEAKLAAQLTHANIIQIYDLGKVGSDFFIAMEHVDGKDLRSILTAAGESGQPIPVGLGLFVARAVARALDYAHRKRDFDNRALGLVHRDVSPQNVLISWEGEIKLCDFGIVKAVAKASTTQMGALKGKLQYMSPEQAWGKNVDARSDIFSLGSVLYELLSGTQLFAGDSEIGVLDAVRECQIRSPREQRPEIPEDVDRIVRKALAKTPEERYQTAGELEHDLGTALDDLRPAPGQKDLAAYLRTLFDRSVSGVIPAPAQPAVETPVPTTPAVETPSAPTPAVETPVPTMPAVETPVASAATAEATAAPAVADDDETPAAAKTGRLKWLIAAVLVSVLIGVGLMVLRSRREVAPAVPGEAPAASQPAAPSVPDGRPPTGAENDASEDARTAEAAAAGAPGEGATGEETAAVEPGDDAQDAAASLAATTAAAGIDIEQMVNDELNSRAERLRQDFEAEKRRLEEELAKTRAADPPPPDKPGGGRP